MLLKRFHDDNEPIVALKRFRIYKNRENIGKHWSMEWNRRISGTSEQGEHQSAERCQKTVGNIRNIRVRNRKTSEYGKHWKTLETLETSEYGIGRHRKHRKHWSVKQEWKFRVEFKIEYGYITAILSEKRMIINVSKVFLIKKEKKKKYSPALL